MAKVSKPSDTKVAPAPAAKRQGPNPFKGFFASGAGQTEDFTMKPRSLIFSLLAAFKAGNSERFSGDGPTDSEIELAGKHKDQFFKALRSGLEDHFFVGKDRNYVALELTQLSLLARHCLVEHCPEIKGDIGGYPVQHRYVALIRNDWDAALGKIKMELEKRAVRTRRVEKGNPKLALPVRFPEKYGFDQL